MNFLSISIIVSAVISLMFYVLGESYEKPELNEAKDGTQIEEVVE